MNFLIVSFFMISMNITEGLLLRYNSPLINNNPNNKISLYGNGGGGGNYILNGGNGGNDDDGDINFFISLICLNIFMMKSSYKNNNLFDLIFYNNYK